MPKEMLSHVAKELPAGGVEWKIIPKKMALVVIDMQNVFCAIGGGMEIPSAREAVPSINRLAGTCRKAGIPVIWVRRIHTRDGSDVGLLKHFWPVTLKGDMSCVEGTRGIELYEGLRIESSDIWVTKLRYSAFVGGSSKLERVLRGLERDTVMIAGVASNWCCMSTIINGMELDFKMIAVSDGMATFTTEQHEEFLRFIALGWAQVMSTAGLVSEIEACVRR